MLDFEEVTKQLSKEMKKQIYGIISTIRNDTPHPTLVSFATTDDLTKIIFFSPKQSRKFINVQFYPNVSFFIDTTTNSPKDIENAITITAYGTLKTGQDLSEEEKEKFSKIYLEKNPQMDFFITPSVEIMVVEVERYEYVPKFQSILDLKQLGTNLEFDIRQIHSKISNEGYHRGRARIINSEEDLAQIDPSEIIFARSVNDLDLDNIDFSGLVEINSTDKGVQLSKEKDIPYLGQFPDFMDKLENGDQITVDGYLGFIIIHKIK